MFDSGSAMYSCPLAMTDGAATVIRNILKKSKQSYDEKTLKMMLNAYDCLTSTDADKFWTSG